MAKILVTGATSFIGKLFINRMLDRGHEVVGVSRPDSTLHINTANKNFKSLRLDLSEYSQLGRLVGPVDYLFCLAWNGTRAQARLNKDLQHSNYVHSMEGLHSVLAAGCKTVMSAGSQAEYGNANGIITEETICKPVTAYGENKLKFFVEGSELAKRYGCVFKEPRFFSLYGPNDYAGTMIISTLSKMLKNEACDLTLCTQKWDFLYISDAIDALELLLTRESSAGAFNFGSGDCRPLKNFVLEMKNVTKSDRNLNFGAVPYPSTGPVSIFPSVSKLKQELAWEPKISFKEGITKILKEDSRLS